MELNKVYLGDCVEVMKDFPDNSIDAICCDPPYGLSFMGKKWDYDVPSQEIWQECLRVLKHGGYLLSFAGTRTQHRMAVRIEDAGFEIRDMIAWVYGSGFPKSLNIGKAVDKLQGNEREDLGDGQYANRRPRPTADTNIEGAEYGFGAGHKITKGTSEWEGWGTALKPALEPITVARKPLSEKTVAENCLKWGVGGINIDGCRVGTGDDRTSGGTGGHKTQYVGGELEQKVERATGGRFPANLIHDGSDEVVSLFPNTESGALKPYKENHTNASSYHFDREKTFTQEANSGSASRFFYCAKASKSERNRGCEGLESKPSQLNSGGIGRECSVEKRLAENGENAPTMKNNHPTVKPIALMEYLVKLVSREGAVVLDPFAGSGSTLIACKNLKRNYIGIELSPEYCKIAQERLDNATNSLF